MDPTDTTDAGHPVTFSVDYPDRPLNRVTTGLRIFMLIPIAILIATVNGPSARSWTAYGGQSSTIVIGAGGLLFLGPLLMILFRQKYPHWWFEWNLQLLSAPRSYVRPVVVMGHSFGAAIVMSSASPRIDTR